MTTESLPTTQPHYQARVRNVISRHLANLAEELRQMETITIGYVFTRTVTISDVAEDLAILGNNPTPGGITSLAATIEQFLKDARHASLDELSAQAQELNMGY